MDNAIGTALLPALTLRALCSIEHLGTVARKNSCEASRRTILYVCMVSVDWLFLDMNAYFASAEQQLRPELRGRPVAVVPTETDRTCCIAVSYEARAWGVKTGTNVGLARQLCPGLVTVRGQHEDYIRLHHQILAAVETVLPIHKVCSIDEMSCPLSPPDRAVDRAREKALAVKEAIARDVGPYLRCSVGLAPNRFLAKVASNWQKPNGLTVITREELPHRLHSLDLEDLPGIARNMRRRLESCGVRTTRQLCALSRPAMIVIWRSVVGAQWWHWLRGDELPDHPDNRQTVGHSHVLPPPLRTSHGARAVMIRLLHKAAARLRRLERVASRIDLVVGFVDDRPSWHARSPLARVNDTPTMLRVVDQAWRESPPTGRPIKASITLSRLSLAGSVAPSLFPEERAAHRAAEAMDLVNERCGPNSLYFASMHETREAAPLRISFTNIPDIPAEQGG